MRKRKKQQLNKDHTSQAVGLDIALALVNFITGKDNLHYGFWDNIEVNLGNLGHAQDAYTEKLLSYLPKKKNLDEYSKENSNLFFKDLNYLCEYFNSDKG